MREVADSKQGEREMTTPDFDRRLEKPAEEVLSGMKEWRIQPSTGDIEEDGRGARSEVESDGGAAAGGYGVGE